MLNYYYMTPAEQRVFDSIRAQAKKCDGKLTIDYIERFRQVINALQYDCPETFSINWSKYSYTWNDSKKDYINVQYTPVCNAATYPRVIKKADELCKRVTGKTEWAKVKQVHDVIIQTVEYDKKYYEKTKLDDDLYNPHRHSIYGPLMEGLSVCEGIAQLMNYMLNRLGVFCYVACGEIKNSGELHAWNIVKIEDDYYHVDTTFDLGQTEDKKSIRYDYFCLDDKTIMKDRKFTGKDVEYIRCQSLSHEFYRTQKLYVSAPSQLPAFFKQHDKYLKKITFRSSDSVSDDDIDTAYSNALTARGLYGYRYSTPKNDVGVTRLRWVSSID